MKKETYVPLNYFTVESRNLKVVPFPFFGFAICCEWMNEWNFYLFLVKQNKTCKIEKVKLYKMYQAWVNLQKKQKKQKKKE